MEEDCTCKLSVPPIKIGERFKYLGIEMLCVGHGISYGYHNDYPCIEYEYVNNMGNIVEGKFKARQFPAIIAENNRE